MHQYVLGVLAYKDDSEATSIIDDNTFGAL